jgi:hypothetical protein
MALTEGNTEEADRCHLEAPSNGLNWFTAMALFRVGYAFFGAEMKGCQI